MDPRAIVPWKKRGSKPLGSFRIFRMREDQSESPRTGEVHPFLVLECPDWVNVVALTADDQLILVEQFRHGSETVELEVPGGVMDPRDASPIEAAIRELREETGYGGSRARLIGSVFANPAIQSNRCHTVLIEDCRLIHARELDPGEDLNVHLVPAGEAPDRLTKGQFRHSLVVVALAFFLLGRRGRTEAGQ